VSWQQQRFCSFDGTAFLIRALGSPVQTCEDQGGGYPFIRQSILSPAGRGTYFLRPFQLACASMETAQCGLSGAERDNQGGIVVKSQRPTQAKNALELSRAIIARHYLDLQRLRDEVRKAENKPRSARAETDKNNAVRAPRSH